jgi:predicted secreted protein
LIDCRKCLTIIIFFAVPLAGAVSAGEVASFVDLGFSENGGKYIFAQYGVGERDLLPWSELYVVDVERNAFADNGRVLYRHDTPIVFGEDGESAFLRLLSSSEALFRGHGASLTGRGIPLFISLEATLPQTAEFRDFENGVRYSAALNMVPQDDGGTASSFYIHLESRDANGTVKNYLVGNPGIRRAGVSGYAIKRAVINRERTSMALIIEMTVQNNSGTDIRYMVETVRL